MAKSKPSFIYDSIPLQAFAVFGGLYGLWMIGDYDLYRRIMAAWGVVSFRFPFLDSYGVLAARECSARGVNVFVTNPCDLLGRLHDYSPFWLLGGQVDIPVADTQTIGILLGLIFLASLWLLPSPRPGAAYLATLAATLSTASLYAMERGNVDLAIFALITASGRLATVRGGVRFIGYGGLLGATFLKFYPLVLVVTATRERLGTFLAIATAYLLAVAAFVAHYWSALGEIVRNFPHGLPYTDLFGAGNLPRGIYELVRAPMAQGAPPFLPETITFSLCGAFLILWAATLRRHFAQTEAVVIRDSITEPAKVYLVMGILLMLGCFCGAQNVYYRAIYFLLTLPALVELSVNARSRSQRLFYRKLVAVILFLMWEEAFRSLVLRSSELLPAALANRLVILFWLGRELTWWWLMAAFVAILFRLIADSPSGREFMRVGSST